MANSAFSNVSATLGLRGHVPVHLDVQSLVDLVLHGEPVAVPAESTFHMEAALMRVARYDVLEMAAVVENPCRSGKKGGEISAISLFQFITNSVSLSSNASCTG